MIQVKVKIYKWKKKLQFIKGKEKNNKLTHKSYIHQNLKYEDVIS